MVSQGGEIQEHMWKYVDTMMKSMMILKYMAPSHMLIYTTGGGTKIIIIIYMYIFLYIFMYFPLGAPYGPPLGPPARPPRPRPASARWRGGRAGAPRGPHMGPQGGNT